MAIAVLVGAYVFARQLRRRGIDPDHVYGMLLLAIPLGIAGARLFHILDNLRFYWHHPGQLWTLQLIGLAIYGVITGGVLAVFIYCRWKKLPFLRVLDALALAIPVGQLIGKCANIINGDTWGYATKLPWGFVYRNPHALLPANLLGVPTQPTPVYEQLWLLVVIAILLYGHAAPEDRRHGLPALPRPLLAGALLHLLRARQRHPLPGFAGGAAGGAGGTHRRRAGGSPSETQAGSGVVATGSSGADASSVAPPKLQETLRSARQ